MVNKASSHSLELICADQGAIPVLSKGPDGVSGVGRSRSNPLHWNRPPASEQVLTTQAASPTSVPPAPSESQSTLAVAKDKLISHEFWGEE